MKKIIGSLISVISALIILAFIAYGIFWIYVAGQMTKTLDTVWNHQEEYQITIDGEQPGITGFPAPPKATFSGSITDRNGFSYSSPEFSYQGFSFPTQSITIAAPQGMDFSGPIFKTTIHLDDFLLRVRLPADFPSRYDRQTLSAWRSKGGNIPIESLRIYRSSVKMEGEGYVTLSQTLQPEGEIKVKVSGLDDLLHEFVQNGTIGEKQAIMAQSLLNLMSQKDETTGVSAINTALRIQDGGVYLGPLRVAAIPEWKWEE
ncbi:MAG: hypothetical protein DI586_05715 [Micavibrio aeruginosavorus]|uniref:DUF2125 domain-containing protein n=1 Tax=Micavibrio aeruginosavorus TaxID=349221 RepID=A0A2W5FPS5_9BACT|nr:MAG: hypothetical protein DI586_05715 [Micavibrio aeruginosavorus]